MGDLINLNERRKKRNKALKAAKSGANRALFGRSKIEKARDEAEKRSLERMLDGAQRGARDEPEADK